jgi:serine/threonine-protein kinase HipA
MRDNRGTRTPSVGSSRIFIEALLPEGWLEHVLSERGEREKLRHGRRYLSNISIVPRGETLPLSSDVLAAPLAKFIEDGRFTGRYAGPASGELKESFEQNLARLYDRAETPRLSGVQTKAPMSLLRDGALVPAVDRPFTHILKPAGTSGFEQLPVVEWLCLELGRSAGFDVPAAALIEMPDGMSPALLVERFDVRRTSRDKRLWALEDFCSVLDVPATAKHEGTIERSGKTLRALSTDPAADLETLLRRAIFAWLIADGDMHLKNLAVLKLTHLGSQAFSAVRFAPLYDAVSTRVFPKRAGDRMALKLNGKDDRLTRADFRTAARTMGVPDATARAACDEITARVSTRIKKLKLPTFARRQAKPVRDALVAIIEARAHTLR